ncbi:MAG: hypothetical protein ACP5OA_05130 [Candidatus Woesearchaeota archaeon]
MFEWYHYAIACLLPGIIVLIVTLFIRQKNCPKCGYVLPKFRKPKSLLQAFGGGSTCPKCGCEVDGKGNEIKDIEQYKKKITNFTIRAITIFLLGIALITTAAFWYADYMFHPYKYSSNPELCERFANTSAHDLFSQGCYYEMAIKNDDVTLCSKISVPSYGSRSRENCLKHFG